MATVSQYLQMYTRQDEYNQASGQRIQSGNETTGSSWNDVQLEAMAILEPTSACFATVSSENFIKDRQQRKSSLSTSNRSAPETRSHLVESNEVIGEDIIRRSDSCCLMKTPPIDLPIQNSAMISEAIQVFNNGLLYQTNGDLLMAKGCFEQASYAVRRILCTMTGSPPTIVMELAMRTHNNLGLINYVDYMYEVATASFEVAISFAEQLAFLSNQHELEYATTMANWCRVACVLGETSDVLYDRLKQIVDIRAKILNWDHPDLAVAYYNIAVVEYSRKNNRGGLSYIEKYLAIATHRSEILKVDDLDKMAAIIFQLLIQNEGKNDDVSRNIVQMLLTLQVKRQNRDCVPLELAAILNVVGSLLFKQKDFTNALVFFQEELRLEEISYSSERSLSWEQSTALCVTCNNIGRIMQELGRYEDATEYYKRVLTAEYGDLRSVTPSTISTANLRTELIGVANASQIPLAAASLFSTVWYNFGLVQDKLGQYDEAIRSFQISLKLRQDILGPDHPDIACLLYNIGVLQMEQKRLDGAFVSLMETLRIRNAKGESQLNDKHIIKAFERLASLFEAKGDFYQVVELLKTIASIYETSKEFDEVTKAKKLGATLRCAADMLLSLNKLTQAIRVARESVRYHRFVVEYDEKRNAQTDVAILEKVANIEQLISVLLLLGSLYHELCEPLLATAVMKEAAMITDKVTLALRRFKNFESSISLLVMHEVTSMLASGCCAPEA